MRFLSVIFCLCLGGRLYAVPPDSLLIRSIYDAALTQHDAYNNLQYLCLQIGGRLSGSAQAQAAVLYTQKLMQQYGLDNVRLQEVKVPHWERGKLAQCRMASTAKGGNRELKVCALGNSAPTPSEGIRSTLVEVQSLDELRALGKKGVEGKIVFFNRPMDPRPILTFQAYGKAGDQRNQGPALASRLGAVAAVVRSLTTASDDYPHTGNTSFDSSTAIPAVAICTRDADSLSTHLKQDSKLKLYLKLDCRTLPDAVSYNVIGELTGTKYPNEVLVVGGHLDSWDLAQGAHDDGTGCIQSIEALRLLKTVGVKPLRTIRVIMFMNEENGHKGGIAYAEETSRSNQKTYAALESDDGGFSPRGFTFSYPASRIPHLESWKKLLLPYGLYSFETNAGNGGVDIGPLAPQGPLLMGLYTDPQRYFDYHHTAQDTFDKVNERELALGSASMASLLLLISDEGLDK